MECFCLDKVLWMDSQNDGMLNRSVFLQRTGIHLVLATLSVGITASSVRWEERLVRHLGGPVSCKASPPFSLVQAFLSLSRVCPSQVPFTYGCSHLLALPFMSVRTSFMAPLPPGKRQILWSQIVYSLGLLPVLLLSKLCAESGLQCPRK